MFKSILSAALLVLLLGCTWLDRCDGFNYSAADAVNDIEKYINDKSIVIKDEDFGPNIQLHHHNNKPMAKYECRALYQSFMKSSSGSPLEWPPPRELPEGTQAGYTVRGLIPSVPSYYAEKQAGGIGYDWKKEFIDKESGIPGDCYGKITCDLLYEKHISNIKGKKGMVVGSQQPWAESHLIRMGASSITTLEYMKIVTDHPKLITMTPFQAAEQFLNGTAGRYDFIFIFSSIEHDGLGRYGDPINPHGDLEVIARLLCILEDDGYLFLGMPMGGLDVLYFNSHRIYGAIRMSMLLSFLQPVDYIGAEYPIGPGPGEPRNNWQHQPIWVFQKRKKGDMV